MVLNLKNVIMDFPAVSQFENEMQTLTRSMKIMKMMMVMINKPKLVGWPDTNMTANLLYANNVSCSTSDLDHQISSDTETKIYQQ